MADNESPIQRQILEYLWAVLPTGSLVAHVPNGNRLVGKTAARAIAKEKWLGMLPGFPDLIALVPGAEAVFFEVKSPKGTVQDNQRQVHSKIAALGFRVAVVRSIDDVALWLAEWGISTRGRVA